MLGEYRMLNWEKELCDDAIHRRGAGPATAKREAYGALRVQSAECIVMLDDAVYMCVLTIH